MSNRDIRRWRVLALLCMLMMAATGCERARNKVAPDNAEVAAPSFAPGSLFAQAWELQQAGNHAQAIEKYKQGLRQPYSAQHSLANFRLGEAQFKIGDLGQAHMAYFNSVHARNLPDALQLEASTKATRLKHYMDYIVTHRNAANLHSPDLADARAVMALLADPAYELKGDQVFDSRSGLTWQRCLVGEVMADAVLCRGLATRMTWEQAQQLPGTGWRLPTDAELLSLHGSKDGRDRVVFPGSDEAPWSAQAATALARDRSAPARLVRSGR